MAFWLKLCGGVVLVIGIIFMILYVIMLLVGAAYLASEGHGGWATAFAALSPIIAILVFAGDMAIGAILYVGGRALQHMDRVDRRDQYSGGSRPRRQPRTRRRVRRRRTHRRIAAPPKAQKPRRVSRGRPGPEDFGEY